MALSGPGTRPRIVVPGYVGYFAREPDAEDDDDYVVRVQVDRPVCAGHHVVPDRDVMAVAIIQSRWQPPRRWGTDWTKPLVACVRIADDGDYVYTTDFGHAVPMTEQSLGERIDRLIANDVAALRAQRGA